MTLDQLILVICNAAIALLALLILLRNPSGRINRSFMALSLGLIVWTTFNYISDHSDNDVLAYTRITFTAGIISILALMDFISHFPNERLLRRSALLTTHKALGVVLIPISLSAVLVSGVDLSASGATIHTSNGYFLYLAFIAYSIALGFWVIQKQRRSAVTIAQKQQVAGLSLGIISYAVFAGFTSVLIPLLVDDWSSSEYGPIAVLFLATLVGYTIVKHGLFDIRMVLARTVAYVTSLGLLAALFGVTVFGLGGLVFQTGLPMSYQIYASVATAVVAISFEYIKQFFTELTNKLFYQDAYDPQTLLDNINKTVVSNNVDVDLLLEKVALILRDAIKSEFILFELRATAYMPERTIGDSTRKFSLKNINDARAAIFHLHKRVIHTDALEEDDPIMPVLRKNNIVVLARLTTAISYDVEGIGYLIMGPKKSGRPFNSKDIDIIRIIAGELSIAVQNALRYEEIENFNATLQDKVDDATKKLKRANDKLKILDETKDEFISMASHQLRTPLTSVKGYLSMVLEGDAGKLNDMQRKLLEQSFTSSQRMVFLIADLLNLSRLRTGKFLVEPVPTNLSDIIQGEVEQLKETAAARSLKLEYDKPETFPTLMLDETKIRQVIMNFVDNAIYYTPSGGKIVIGLAETPKSIEFTVKDSGIGVPKSEQQHLFSKFFRAGNAQKARPDGTGLGLFMAKKVIVALGGALIFSSKEGQGSTFGFSFSKDKIRVPEKPQTAPDTKS